MRDDFSVKSEKMNTKLESFTQTFHLKLIITVNILILSDPNLVPTQIKIISDPNYLAHPL